MRQETLCLFPEFIQLTIEQGLEPVQYSSVDAAECVCSFICVCIWVLVYGCKCALVFVCVCVCVVRKRNKYMSWTNKWFNKCKSFFGCLTNCS